MNSPQQLYEQLDLYLNGMIDASELAAFQDKIKTNSRIAAELQSFQLLRKALAPSRKVASTPSPQKQKITPTSFAQDIESSGSQTPATQRSRVGTHALSILGIVLLFALSIYSVKFLQPNANEDLFSAHFKPAFTVDTFSNHQPKWAQVEKYIESEAYIKAIPILEELLPLSSAQETIQAHYYLGICYLATNDPDHKKVISHLENADVPHNPEHLTVQWYMGLAYLRYGNTSKARSFFERLSGHSKFSKHDRLVDLIGDMP